MVQQYSETLGNGLRRGYFFNGTVSPPVFVELVLLIRPRDVDDALPV